MPNLSDSECERLLHKSSDLLQFLQLRHAGSTLPYRNRESNISLCPAGPDDEDARSNSHAIESAATDDTDLHSLPSTCISAVDVNKRSCVYKTDSAEKVARCDDKQRAICAQTVFSILSSRRAISTDEMESHVICLLYELYTLLHVVCASSSSPCTDTRKYPV